MMLYPFKTLASRHRYRKARARRRAERINRDRDRLVPSGAATAVSGA